MYIWTESTVSDHVPAPSNVRSWDTLRAEDYRTHGQYNFARNAVRLEHQPIIACYVLKGPGLKRRLDDAPAARKRKRHAETNREQPTNPVADCSTAACPRASLCRRRAY